LSVSARQSGNQILIDIVDDGRGIDGAKLVEKAIASGTLSKEDAAALSPRERLALIFEAGLSTAQSVTAISGRGVGMDVVRSNVERIGGIVEVDSAVGRGTRMTLRVPLTLTIIPALTVSIGNQHFAIPRAAIEEIVRANGSSVTLERVGGAGIATIRGRRVPEISLATVLGLESTMSDTERTLVVLKPAGGDLFALAVDRIHDHEELVVKPAAPAVMATGLYAGTTLADDGSPILLFDPAGLAEVGGIRLEMQERGGRVVEDIAAAVVADVPVLLFKGLDGARRALRLGIVDRIEEVPADSIRPGAGRLRVQLGESILPLAGVEPGTKFEGKVRLFRLNDGVQEIGYAFAEVIDLMTIDHDVIPASNPGQVSGVTLIGGEPAELVDAHWLFSEFLGAEARPVAPLVCRLASDDPWMQNMLRPIVEAAGYIVIGERDDLIPDLVIQSDGKTAAKTGSARVLTLAADPDAADGKERIYRYDRAGLMMALKSAGSVK
jgi:two-component system chemotaxis sensor kinase CheA